jgi:hypothetical protein
MNALAPDNAIIRTLGEVIPSGAEPGPVLFQSLYPMAELNAIRSGPESPKQCRITQA